MVNKLEAGLQFLQFTFTSFQFQKTFK